MVADPREPHVGLVVEGAGDRGALPVVLRSYLHARGEYRDILGKPVPLHGRDKAFVPNGIEGYAAVAGARPGCVGVLVVLDAEGDCVAQRGPELFTRARCAIQVPVHVALADTAFEDWLYASAETLRLDGLNFDPQKSGGSMIKHALRPAAYNKPVWQPRLAARMNIDMARVRSPSFDRMLLRFDDLCAKLPRLESSD